MNAPSGLHLNGALNELSSLSSPPVCHQARSTNSPNPQHSSHDHSRYSPINSAVIPIVVFAFNLRGRGVDDLLFSNLGKRKTWLMVQKDLERVGIPYVTPDGIADFHAAGRHTYITELI